MPKRRSPDVVCRLEIVEELAAVDDRPLVTVRVPQSTVRGESSVSVRRALYEAGFRPGDVVEIRRVKIGARERTRRFDGL